MSVCLCVCMFMCLCPCVCVFVQETLQLVRTHYAIMNANAFLLEQVGDVSGAMNLILAHLDRLLTDLKVCVCGL